MKQSKQYTEVSTILLCCPGRFQAYFANCLGDQTKLSGIVIVDSFADSNLEADSGAVRKLSTKIRNKLHYIINPLKLIHQVTIRLRLKPYEASCEESLKAEFQTVLAKQKFPLDIPVLRVADINSPETVEFIKTHNPELICVNGTNLLREPILSLEESILINLWRLYQQSQRVLHQELNNGRMESYISCVQVITIIPNNVCRLIKRFTMGY